MVKRKSILSLVCALALLGGVILTTPGLAAEEEPQWVEKAPMAIGRYGCSAEVVNGKIYVFGGNFLSNNAWSYSDVVEIYDPMSNSWSTGAPMPTPRSFIATVMLDDKIYVIGGNDKYDKNVNEIYDPKTDAWETGAPMNTAGAFLSAVAMNGKIYVLGFGSNEVEIYDPSTNTWTAGTPLPVTLSQTAAVTIQNKIYLFGGSTVYNSVSGISNKVYIYDLTTDTWEQGPDLPVAIFKHTAEVYGNRVYLLGGYSDHVLNTVYVLDLANNIWAQGSSLNTPRFLHTSTLMDKTIYTIGGFTGSKGLSQMEALELPTIPNKSKLSVHLNTAETVQLSVSDTLSDNLNYTWTSTSTSVATVDTNGKVTAVAPGLSTITATNAEGISQSIPVRVLPGTADLFRLAVHLTPGQTQQLGMSVDQEEVAWAWQSLDESVATVDATGKVSALAPGLAIVQATLGNEVQQIYVRVK